MLTYVLQGAGLGFTAGTSFGPLHTILMNTTLSLGWRQGMLIVLAPLLSDLPIIILMLFVLDRLPPIFIPILQIVGGAFVLFIAWQNWKQFRQGGVTLEASGDGTVNVSRQTLFKGITVNFLNPAPYIFWGTVQGPLLISAAQESVWHAAALVITFYGTFLGLMAIFVIIFDRVRGLDPRITRAMILASVVILIILGTVLITQGISGITNPTA